MIDLTVRLVYAGRIAEAAIDHSVFRVLSVKQDYGLLRAD
jgi:hypothetical protein